MITYLLKYRLGSENGIKNSEIPFENANSPISSRIDAYQRYESLLEILGENKDPNQNLSEHIFKYSKKQKLKNSKIEIPMNIEGFQVNLFFVLNEDFQSLKHNTPYLIIGEKEERNYLTLAENLRHEMSYYKAKRYATNEWTSRIKYWNYESDKEKDIIHSNVLFTPFNFWEEWNPHLAEGN